MWFVVCISLESIQINRASIQTPEYSFQRCKFIVISTSISDSQYLKGTPCSPIRTELLLISTKLLLPWSVRSKARSSMAPPSFFVSHLPNVLLDPKYSWKLAIPFFRKTHSSRKSSVDSQCYEIHFSSSTLYAARHSRPSLLYHPRFCAEFSSLPILARPWRKENRWLATSRAPQKTGVASLSTSLTFGLLSISNLFPASRVSHLWSIDFPCKKNTCLSTLNPTKIGIISTQNLRKFKSRSSTFEKVWSISNGRAQRIYKSFFSMRSVIISATNYILNHYAISRYGHLFLAGIRRSTSTRSNSTNSRISASAG